MVICACVESNESQQWTVIPSHEFRLHPWGLFAALGRDFEPRIMGAWDAEPDPFLLRKAKIGSGESGIDSLSDSVSVFGLVVPVDEPSPGADNAHSGVYDCIWSVMWTSCSSLTHL